VFRSGNQVEVEVHLVLGSALHLLGVLKVEFAVEEVLLKANRNGKVESEPPL